MSETPKDLLYAKSHEWVRNEGDGTATIGITDHAQELLGDMVYVELPEAGRSLKSDQDCAVVESVKAASDVYAPVAGEIASANDALADNPELINKAPYGDGWLFTMKPADAAEVGGLMDADAYAAMVAEESE